MRMPYLSWNGTEALLRGFPVSSPLSFKQSGSKSKADLFFILTREV